jgi:hypothetical protein
MVDLSDFGKEAAAKNPAKHSWHQWFAWFPVPTGSGLAWFTTVERKYHTSFFSEAWEYRRIGEISSAYRCTWSFYRKHPTHSGGLRCN